MDKSTANALESGDLSQITTYQAGVIQAMTHRLLQKHCDDILKKYGITKMQWLIIGTVSDAGPDGARVTDLAKILGTTLSYLTNTVNLLESKQILLRTAHKEDNRAKFIYLNPSYTDTSHEIESYLRQKLRTSIYANISQYEFRTYMKVLYRLAQVDK